ncbi:hypothetical protein AbraIFM66951_005460 [Aspergillus brasiliensis]|uniref:Uncharacterized protein n=1 Tax=Aspergillus brasiliensis TaxID=319629 RepID=A0A9W5Z1D1_9EURO|nr:hypothetical protein AbraCBS73388_004823 [Aspergillus brasiliensis]GKZ51313.1 hypothetical protein AbraIFM66951_005460 [Aspergillus brasiliensis]
MVKATILLFSLFTLATAAPATINHATVNEADAVDSALNKRAQEDLIVPDEADVHINLLRRDESSDEQAATSGAAKRQDDALIDADVLANVDGKRNESFDDGSGNGRSDE